MNPPSPPSPPAPPKPPPGANPPQSQGQAQAQAQAQPPHQPPPQSQHQAARPPQPPPQPQGHAQPPPPPHQAQPLAPAKPPQQQQRQQQPPQQQAPQFIEKFGKYNFIKKIGQGGMAEVFTAMADGHPPGTPPVVIKRLHAELEKDRDAVDLFLTEADVTMMLDHPNIIRVHDAGEVGNRYYMVMEYVHGKDLEQIFDRCQAKGMVLPPEVAAHITCEVLRGLDYVHSARTPSGRELGIVHRDVTPSNVYVSASGRIKLGDFGVAKLVGVEGWTMSGSLKGKLGYLSPEQIAGEQPSQSIDVWAASVIFYELLSGTRAFLGGGGNELDVMLRIKKAKLARVRKANKNAPRNLEKILKRALHRKEKKRYQTAGELLAAIEAASPKRFSEQELVQHLTQILA